MPSTHDNINTPDESPTTIRARIGGATRRGNAELAAEARRDLKVKTIEQRVRELVDSWPPITREQMQRIADLLNLAVVERDDTTPSIPQQRDGSADDGGRLA